MKNRIANFLYTLLFILFLVSKISFAQDISRDDYVKLIDITNPQEKIDSLNKFRNEYPSSRYFSHSLTETFAAYVQLGNADSAIFYADKYLNLFPEASRENAYNSIAYELAEKKIGLDSAESYINKAVALAKANGSRRLQMLLDTQALVLFDLGKTDQAIEAQKQAMAGNEDNPDYIMHLAVYQEAAGNRKDALETISKSILLGRSQDKAIEYFNSWLEKESPDASSREKLKSGIINQTIKEYLNTDKTPGAKSKAAAFLASLKFDLPLAEKYAKEAVAAIDDKSSSEDVGLYKLNLASVYNGEGNYKKCLNELLSVKDLAAPWDTDFWYLLGSTYEKLGKDDNALDSYLMGMIFPEENNVSKAVKRLSAEKGMSQDVLDKKMEELKEGMKEFDTGKFKKTSKTNKVVVAELFTGAECPPCVAADEAFDKLAEYYPKNDVVILEYHVHIPGPDPMTNPDSFSKYSFYGGNFGTPTVLFDGTEKMTGGGPVYVTKNRYTVYKYSLDRLLKEKPGANISGSAKLDNDKVNVNVNIEPVSKENLNGCQIQIALVEKSIKYTGANGISKHIYVVRNLVNGADGIKVNLANGKQTVKESIDVAQVENGIKTYLDDPTGHPSWRRGTSFSGWKERTDKIDRGNLAIVVYVQNTESKKILQAKYFNLDSDIKMGANN